MPRLQSIASLPADELDLLEAVGYLDAQELCEANPVELLDELIKANRTLELIPHEPTAELLDHWKGEAKKALGDAYVAGAQAGAARVAPSVDSGEQPDEREAFLAAVAEVPVDLNRRKSESPVNFEDDLEVQSMLDVSPEAEPVPAELIKRHNLAVSDIAEGVLLTDCQGDVEMKVVTPKVRKQQQRRINEVKRTGLMTSRIRDFNQAESDDHHVKPLDKGAQRDVVSVSAGLNAGISPESRRFVRGVLHPEPWRVRTAAFFSVLVQLLLVLTVFGVPVMIFVDQMYDWPQAVWWTIGLVSALALSALCYLFWGIVARCRVCGQRQFAPKKCLKNRKAHHIPLIGYIFPTALHAMFYKWFYCTYCGTAVRLKR
ncbi:hypothetical protein HW115_11985 [Verrucomicrobiaceae bacterium N1E253]|uniref:DUF4332 domain-containing protein n=1 Tax=Oceaniferula marina TaxID=2748318 RepID=A0A851GQA1_9BACT|nr:hypothetical protein [Oceaniferula marina]NWK56334.1 hypothetical protein [Oceaniferula marina]